MVDEGWVGLYEHGLGQDRFRLLKSSFIKKAALAVCLQCNANTEYLNFLFWSIQIMQYIFTQGCYENKTK